VIAAAKGMVMERFQIDADEAWDLMRRLAMDTNTAVYDIARRLLRGLGVNPYRPHVLR
jgi:AmiR/NasT family two-component response regulator